MAKATTIFRAIARFLKNPYHLSLAGIIIYNNWLLAVILNPRATFAGATTSELQSLNQPWSLLFRFADMLAALLLVLGIKSFVALGANRLQRLFLALAMLFFALSTFVETLLPFQCSPAVSSACALKDRLGVASWSGNLHVYESVISYMLMFLLPLAVILATRLRAKLKRRVDILSWFLMAAMAAWGIESLIRLLNDAVSYGYEQRLFNIILSLWFIVVIRSTRLLNLE